MSSTEEWLRARADPELAELLSTRPDVLLPAPPDFATLARRLDSSTTVRRVVAGCNSFELQILQALWVLSDPATPADIAALLGGPATAVDVARTVGHLHTLGLIRLTGAHYVLGPTAGEALGRFPAGLGASSHMDADTVSNLLSSIDEIEKGLLQRLVPGPPIGSAPPDSPQRPMLVSLVARGLLVELPDGTVALPREVALALRGTQPLGPATPTPPAFSTTKHRTGTIDAASGGQALAARDTAVHLLNLLGTQGAPALKSGGIGVVAVRTLTKHLDAPIATVALYLELLHGLGMIAPAVNRGHATAIWLPTQAADTFITGAEQGGWALLAGTWLNLRRDPSKTGEHDATGKAVSALSVAADWRRGPAQRRQVLGQLSELAADTSTDPASIVARLHFSTPMANVDALNRLTSTVLAEATELGVVAFNALSTPGRSVLDGDIEGAAEALERTLPKPVETVLVQADMTIIAPGRLTPNLAAALAEVADVESSGSATVYRISEGSVRRALDAGATRTELQQLLETHSSTKIPQSVTYLIDDVARRHGVIRAGSVASVVHSDDPALIAQAVAAAGASGIPLRTLAPTVAVSSVDLETLVEALRSAGLAPAAEDAHGDVIDLRPAPRRTRAAMPAMSRYIEQTPPTEQQLAAVIARMRANYRAGAANSAGASGVDARDIVALLREAAAARSAVWIGYADAEGGTSSRPVEPIVVSGGTMVAFDKLRNAPRTFVLSRISSAQPDQP
ncbi:MAG: helicase-associated domain-containing protein [Nakamurella sp.]